MKTEIATPHTAFRNNSLLKQLPETERESLLGEAKLEHYRM